MLGDQPFSAVLLAVTCGVGEKKIGRAQYFSFVILTLWGLMAWAVVDLKLQKH